MAGEEQERRRSDRRLAAGAALLVGLLIALAASLPGPASAQLTASKQTPRVGDGRGGFRLKRVGNFDSPVYVNGPKGANGLLFVVEQRGVIRLVKGGHKLGGAFLDIRDKVSSGGERGLLSVAFPRSYARSHRFYVFFTGHKGDLTVQEYRTSRRNPRKAKRGSARTVIRIRHRKNANHNGGQLQFGPDGDLYISTGDGGSGGDPPENAQNKNRLLGKILRIDPRKPKRHRKGGRGYTIPRSNPFVHRKGADEIFSYGLRNPFRFSFDKRRIAIGDVGQDTREEVDYERLGTANGGNFGWDAFEGSKPFDSPDASPPPKHTIRPILDYTHAASGGCAITGGYVVRDHRIPSLYGRYVYSDFCAGQIRSLIPRTNGARDDRSAGLPKQSGISSFGVDAHRHLYVTHVNSGALSEVVPKG